MPGLGQLLISAFAEVLAVSLREVAAVNSGLSFLTWVSWIFAGTSYGFFFASQEVAKGGLQRLYPAWSGITTILSFLVGVLLNGEKTTQLPLNILGIVVTVIGILLVSLR